MAVLHLHFGAAQLWQSQASQQASNSWPQQHPFIDSQLNQQGAAQDTGSQTLASHPMLFTELAEDLGS